MGVTIMHIPFLAAFGEASVRGFYQQLVGFLCRFFANWFQVLLCAFMPTALYGFGVRTALGRFRFRDDGYLRLRLVLVAMLLELATLRRMYWPSNIDDLCEIATFSFIVPMAARGILQLC
jgi:hypothetical protein